MGDRFSQCYYPTRITKCCVLLRWEGVLLERWGRAETFKSVSVQTSARFWVLCLHRTWIKKQERSFFQLHVDNKEVSISKNPTAGQQCHVLLLDMEFKQDSWKHERNLIHCIVAHLTNSGMMVLNIQCNHEGNMHLMRWWRGCVMKLG